MKKILSLLIILGISSTIFPGMPQNAFAATPGDMLGVEGNGSDGTKGGLNLVDQTDGSLTLIGDPVTPRGLSGVAIDSSGTVFGSVVGGGNPSNLVIIDPDNGNLLSTVGIITDLAGTQISIGDLAVQPGTDVLFGIGSNSAGNFGGLLYTIDTTTAQATFVGDTGAGTAGGLGFAPDGTLYFIPLVSELQTLDPTNADVLTSTPSQDLDTYDGLGVRGDGIIFISQGKSAGSPYAIATVDPTNGVVNILGSNTDEVISDLDFIPGGEAIGGEIIPINSTALFIAGLQSMSVWMIPTLAGVVGVGAYYIRTKMNKA